MERVINGALRAASRTLQPGGEKEHAFGRVNRLLRVYQKQQTRNTYRACYDDELLFQLKTQGADAHKEC